MKVKNRQMVNFVNSAGSILAKKIPHKLYFAISQNMVALQQIATIYNAKLEEVGTENTEEVNELLNIESEVVLQTIPKAVMESMDQEKYDALTGIEYSSLEFLMEE